MPVGTPVLAAGDGKVVQVEMNHDGIGYHANIIVLEHPNGVRTGYAHLKKDSAVVKIGDYVIQGQKIALSGLTGQTPFPHLHFFATNLSGTEPRPISFKDVPSGIPFAGRFYTSDNKGQ